MCLLYIGFQSTPPVKAATNATCRYAVVDAISIHAAREGGDCRYVTKCRALSISIHAAREGGDLSEYIVLPPKNISIHAAREGGDNRLVSNAAGFDLFQSTPPVKAAT